MIGYILKRILESTLVLWAVVTLAFLMVKFSPGDPFSSEREMSEIARAAMNARYGLDQPLYVQYGRYLGNLIQGDLGISLSHSGWTVNELLADRIPVSLELGALGLLIALTLGLSAGLLAAARPNRFSDYLPMSLAMLGISLPTFVVGPLLLWLFGIELGWFNTVGWESPIDRVLPALTLGLFYGAFIARLTRGSMVEVRNSDYARTARAKGLPEWRVYLVHCLRNGMHPVISFMGPAAAGLISGSFIVETIFNIPGLGTFFVKAPSTRDETLMLGIVIFYSALILAFNLIVDIILVLLDPKQKFN